MAEVKTPHEHQRIFDVAVQQSAGNDDSIYAYFHKPTKQMYVAEKGAQTEAVMKHHRKAQNWYGWSGIPIITPIGIPMGAYHTHKAKAAVGAPRIFSTTPRRPKF